VFHNISGYKQVAFSFLPQGMILSIINCTFQVFLVVSRDCCCSRENRLPGSITVHPAQNIPGKYFSFKTLTLRIFI